MIMRSNLSRPVKRTADPRLDGVVHSILSEAGVELKARGGAEMARYLRTAIREAARRDAQLSTGRMGGSSPDAAKIEAAYIGFGTMLHNRLKRPGGLARRFATMIRTNKLLDRQLWLDSNPKMRLWEGDKVLSMLRGESLPIITKPHEASIIIPKGDILNDEFDLYKGRINSLADSYDWHLDEVFIGMLVAGLQGSALGTTYDGQNLIDTDHTFLGNGSGVQYSNRVTGAFSSTVYANAWNAYLSMKDENGLPVTSPGEKLYLIHGPANRTAVRAVLQQENIVGATQTNLDKGTAEPVCTPWITAGAVYNVGGVSVTLTGLEWFLIKEGSTAVMIQIKRDVEFLAVEGGEFSFRTGKYLYGIESEDGAAYGMPQDIVGGPGA